MVGDRGERERDDENLVTIFLKSTNDSYLYLPGVYVYR
ncbi:unnamed protein product [Onchocerca flexuosa]|uniref:Uncharacterized protein n=1 Tax=Onchocerca flexuosa TaxID=387005 RepID=A0A183HWZ7_9BILA|nr:unnamed protein product [Onchocerca flexuosa]